MQKHTNIRLIASTRSIKKYSPNIIFKIHIKQKELSVNEIEMNKGSLQNKFIKNIEIIYVEYNNKIKVFVYVLFEFILKQVM